MADPRRREQRRTHLDASIVPVERALIARAGILDEQAAAARKSATAGTPLLSRDGIPYESVQVVADEFRALAEELHFW